MLGFSLAVLASKKLKMGTFRDDEFPASSDMDNLVHLLAVDNVAVVRCSEGADSHSLADNGRPKRLARNARVFIPGPVRGRGDHCGG